MNKKALLIVAAACLLGAHVHANRFAKRKKTKICHDSAPPVISSIDVENQLDQPVSSKELILPGHLGRAYYESLVQRQHAITRYWVLPITMRYTFGNHASDCEGCKVPLSNLIFGREFTIQDIYLPSRLSRDRKVRIDQDPANANLAVGDLLPFERVPNVANIIPFGNYGSDQYIGLLAPMKVGITAERNETGSDISGIYPFMIGDPDDVCGTQIRIVLGATLSFKTIEHRMDLHFSGASFNKLRAIPAAQNVTPANEMAIEQFFADFSDVEDFFVRAVLAPKGLTFKSRQRKTGIGDIKIFALADLDSLLSGFSNYINSVQVGFNIVVPTGNKDKGCTIWEPVLGNGGAFQFELFANAMFSTPFKAINPVLRVVGGFSGRYTNYSVRVPKVKTSTTSRPGLVRFQDIGVPLSPEINRRFGDGNPGSRGFFVEPFEESEVNIPMFANTAVPTRIKYGSKFIFGIGNYSYDVFNLGFRIGVFYEYMHKRCDSLSVKCDPEESASQFDTDAIIARTDRRAHTFSGDFMYKFKNGTEAGFGLLGVFAGKNVPRHGEIFTSFNIVF